MILHPTSQVSNTNFYHFNKNILEKMLSFAISNVKLGAIFATRSKKYAADQKPERGQSNKTQFEA